MVTKSENTEASRWDLYDFSEKSGWDMLSWTSEGVEDVRCRHEDAELSFGVTSTALVELTSLRFGLHSVWCIGLLLVESRIVRYRRCQGWVARV